MNNSRLINAIINFISRCDMMEKVEKLFVFTDGGAVGNPGPVAVTKTKIIDKHLPNK